MWSGHFRFHFVSPSVSKEECWKSNLCQGTLNPLLGKRTCPGQESSLFPLALWGSGEWQSWSFCPAAQRRADEQPRLPINSLELIQAAVCSSLARPVQGFPPAVLPHGSWLAGAHLPHLTPGEAEYFSR